MPSMGGVGEEGSYLARGSSTWEDPGDSRSDVREERPIECQDVWPLLAGTSHREPPRDDPLPDSMSVDAGVMLTHVPLLATE